MNGSKITLRGVPDVISFLDSNSGIQGQAGIIWWLALGGGSMPSPIPP